MIGMQVAVETNQDVEHGGSIGEPSFQMCRRPVTCLLAAFILISPIGFYFGMMDAYLAHNLYSSNVPTASVTPPTWRLFNVPFPPEHRLFEQHFRLTCSAGETLTIRDKRWWYQQQGLDRRTLTCDKTEMVE